MCHFPLFCLKFRFLYIFFSKILFIIQKGIDTTHELGVLPALHRQATTPRAPCPPLGWGVIIVSTSHSLFHICLSLVQSMGGRVARSIGHILAPTKISQLDPWLDHSSIQKSINQTKINQRPCLAN